MISRNPMGTDICPYGGWDDELLTTEHPRDPEGTRPLVLCMQETLALCIKENVGAQCTLGIRMQMRGRVAEQRWTLWFIDASPWLEVDTRLAL